MKHDNDTRRVNNPARERLATARKRTLRSASARAARSSLFHDPERLVAGVVGLIVAYRSRNVLVTISAGMGTLWLMKLVFQG